MRRLLAPLVAALLCLSCIVVPIPGGHGRGRVVVRESEQRSTAGAEVVARAAAIAAALTEPLRRLEISIGRWRVCLNAGRCSEEEFLSTTESELLGILAGPELAALRDWAAEGFRAARADLAAATKPGVRLASMRATEEGGAADLFAKVLALVQDSRELAEKNALLTDLCVVSKPVDGAWLELWPRSAPDRNVGTLTAGKLANLYRGLYSYRVEHQGYGAILCQVRSGERGCPQLNLVDDPQPILECDLRAGRCGRKSGPVEACDGAR
jgi:hypothetical protein